MSDKETEEAVSRLEAELARVVADLVKRDQQLEELEVRTRQAEMKAAEADETAVRLQRQLEEEHVHSELTTLREVNELHREHK